MFTVVPLGAALCPKTPDRMFAVVNLLMRLNQGHLNGKQPELLQQGLLRMNLQRYL